VRRFWSHIPFLERRSRLRFFMAVVSVQPCLEDSARLALVLADVAADALARSALRAGEEPTLRRFVVGLEVAAGHFMHTRILHIGKAFA